MSHRLITDKIIESFRRFLTEEEKSNSTIEKYMRDVKAFAKFLCGGEVTKDDVISYKKHLLDKGYRHRSINSMLASINSLFAFLQWREFKVKSLRIQKEVYSRKDKELSKEEYNRLVNAAELKENERLSLIIQTICGTGIRVSELEFITVEAVKKSEAAVSLKGKTRTVLIIEKLKKKLLRYAAEQGIHSGCIFITRTGKPISRINIWREMKKLCELANVNPSKVFPHNLRHLFARTFYNIEKDIAKLADILGHSSIETTRIYIITTIDEHRRKMENMKLVI